MNENAICTVKIINLPPTFSLTPFNVRELSKNVLKLPHPSLFLGYPPCRGKIAITRSYLDLDRSWVHQGMTAYIIHFNLMLSDPAIFYFRTGIFLLLAERPSVGRAYIRNGWKWVKRNEIDLKLIDPSKVWIGTNDQLINLNHIPGYKSQRMYHEALNRLLRVNVNGLKCENAFTSKS